MKRLRLFFIGCVAASLAGVAGENAADMSIRIKPDEVLRYRWDIQAKSESSGREQGRPFTIGGDTHYNMNVILKGLAKRPDGMPISLRWADFSYTDIRSIADSKIEVSISKGKVKVVENGNVIVDSDNDIGADKINPALEHIKSVESRELRTTLDPAGRQGELEGDQLMAETIKNSGAQGLFPILAGRDVKPGETWTDSFTIPNLGDFKLAQPIVVRSKMNFTKWEEKDGKKFARIDVASAWDATPVNGENSNGVLVEITGIEGSSTGSCLFDPETGHYVEGTLSDTKKYHVDGEQKGARVGLDVKLQSKMEFKLSK